MFPAFLRRLFSPRRSPNDDAAELRRLVENSRDVLCRVGPDMRIRYCSPAAPIVLGLPCDQMLGRLPSDFVLEEDRPLIMAEARRVATGEEARPTIVRVLRPDGALVWVETTTRTIRDPDSGRPDEFVLVMRDVSERHLAHRRLEQDVVTDALTGLANRRAFDETLALEWARAARHDTELSLILVDVDHFKAFNDHYGHPAGDSCLRQVAGAIQGVIRRPGDLAARYGGEEVAIILPRTPAAGAALVAESLRIAVEGLRAPHDASPAGRLTVSVGAATTVASVGDFIPMPEGLVIAADGALYRAKNRGRNRVETTTLLPPRSSIRVA